MQGINRKDITAVILAGGQGRRMGGEDKGLIDFNGRTIIETLIDKLKQQQVNAVINANRNHDRYLTYGLPIISDELADFQGPLAGFATAMHNVETDYILTLPCDGPFLADNFVDLFLEIKSHASIYVAHDGERLQPVYALLKVELLDDLLKFLETDDRKIDRWYAQHDFVTVDFSSQKNMFVNINRPEDQDTLLNLINR
ncbi:MAG: molybdenum cofactor guanylyltransferase [Gammaproteobacteria bacterium]|nr:molybdenum cofactor guanylyltransferase [Gammaproteobacteria bacterium]